MLHIFYIYFIILSNIFIIIFEPFESRLHMSYPFTP